MNDIDENTGMTDDVVETLAITQPGTILFPFALTPLVLDNPGNIARAEKAAPPPRLIAVFPEMPRNEDVSEIQGIELNVTSFKLDDHDVSSIGVLCRLVKTLKFPDGTVRILLRGLERIRYEGPVSEDSPLLKVRKIVQPEDNSIETAAMVRNAVKQFQEITTFSPNFPEELKIAIINLTDNVRIVDLIADSVNFSNLEKLAILTMEKLQDRLHLMMIYQ